MGLKYNKNRRTDALARTNWAEVERLLAEHYRRTGYAVDHCGTGASGSRYDGGIDIKLRRDNEYIIVQCKHWNAMKVPHNDVHQLMGIMVNEGATGAILVTSGEFTRAAVEAATRQGHVQLVDGDDVREMLGPLPEPAVDGLSRWEKLTGSDIGRHAAGATRYVGGRLLNAAEDRIRGEVGQRTRGSTVVGTAIRVMLIKAALGLAFMFFVLVVVVMLFNSVVKSLTPKPPATNAVPVAVSAPADTPATRPRLETLVAEPIPQARRAPAYREQTPEEYREWKRKEAESIKILEATTPELYNGEGPR
jgi:hypothetical protein